jgi:phenylacetate-CoA ligase
MNEGIPWAFDWLQKVQGRNISRLYRQKAEQQWCSTEEIRAELVRRLDSLVRRSSVQVPYFRDILGGSEVGITSLEQFGNLFAPMSKEEVRENLDRLHATDGDRRLTIHRTGGSSGQPLEYPRDRHSVANFWADFFLTRSWWAVQPSAPSATIWGHYSEPGTWINEAIRRIKDQAQRWALRTRFLSAYQLTAESMRAFAAEIERFQVQSIYGYASAILTFAQFIQGEGLTLGLPKDMVLICTSEPLPTLIRDQIQAAFGRGVANEYGACEVGIIGFECPGGTLHLLELSNYVEVLNTDGDSVEDELGEILVTPLHNRSVPIFRYQLGDVGQITNRPCSCGRQGRSLERLEGRTWSMLQNRFGTAIYPQIITQVVLSAAPSVRRFQAIQDTIDHVTVRLEVSQETSSSRTGRIAAELERYLEGAVRVEVHAVDRIDPEPSGKYLVVKSDVQRHSRSSGG